ncbi:MAG TPA: hypothetical protein VKE70_30260 [Candidatus Solibacter sp.]|nr:hypothetical protein [Candidatus Solibacter sp.]
MPVLALALMLGATLLRAQPECDFSFPGAAPETSAWLEIHDSAGFIGTRFRLAAYADGTWLFQGGDASTVVSGRLSKADRQAWQQFLRERKIFELTSAASRSKDAAAMCIRASFDGRKVLARIAGDHPLAVLLRERCEKLARTGHRQ